MNFCVRSNGECCNWLNRASPAIKKLGECVNGPLFEKLACDIDYHDVACVDILRDGCMLFDDDYPFAHVDGLVGMNEYCSASNDMLLSSLKPDAYETELHELAQK